MSQKGLFFVYDIVDVNAEYGGAPQFQLQRVGVPYKHLPTAKKRAAKCSKYAHIKDGSNTVVHTNMSM